MKLSSSAYEQTKLFNDDGYSVRCRHCWKTFEPVPGYRNRERDLRIITCDGCKKVLEKRRENFLSVRRKNEPESRQDISD